MVYISSLALSSASRASVMQTQVSLAKVQQELSSGKMADVGLGLGSGSAQFVSLGEQQSRLQAVTDGNGLATTRLAATSSALDGLSTSATAFLASLTAASSSPSGFSAVASEARSNLGALVSTLNASVAGQYIFGGINTDVQPMAAYTVSPASATKQAVDTAFTAAFGMSQSSAGASGISAASIQNFLDTNFASLFAPASFAGTWSAASDQTVSSQISMSERADTSVSANAAAFRDLAQAYTMVAEFGGGNLDAAASQVVAAAAAKLVGSAQSELTGLGAGVGIVQSAISDSNSRMATQISLFSSQADTLQSVDPYALSTQVTSLQTQLQASYELTSQLQQLSLVNYLK